MTLSERIQDNEYAETSCHHCGKVLHSSDDVVADIEFHNDGTYCSKQCLTEEMKMIEAWNASYFDNEEGDQMGVGFSVGDD